MAHSAIGFDPLAFHARFRAEAPACIDLASGEVLTYREFDARVSICASNLAERFGPASGERIAVLGRNSANQAVLAMACERAGLVFTPLSWRLAVPEITGLLVDCEPKLLVVDAEFEDTAREAAAQAKVAVSLATYADLARPGGKAEPVAGSADDPCIILYTSGTTGRPKGVIITRENALYSSLNFSAVAVVGPRARLLCDSPLFHTVGLVAILRTALLQGGCAILSDRFIPSATLQRLSDPQLGVTHYFVVPQMIEALLREPAAQEADFSRLIALFSGGGPLPAELIARLAQRGVKLVNGFGMSEIGSGIHMPLDPAFIAANPHAVGFPAPYLEVKLARENGEEVAPGEIGEIWMRGPSISPGYWRQDDATRASRHGDWFRSGDLARREASGAYAIVDRLKDMYISGGENVCPAEVELVLRQLPGVADAAVIGAPDARWGECGAAFIQRQANTLSEQAVREWCTGRLARFKQPAHIRFVEELPRTGSGKVRKDVLRKHFAPQH